MTEPRKKASKPRPRNLGEVLRIYRAVKGLPIRRLASEMGMTAGTLWRLEEGREIELTTFMALLRWFQEPHK